MRLLTLAGLVYGASGCVKPPPYIWGEAPDVDATDGRMIPPVFDPGTTPVVDPGTNKDGGACASRFIGGPSFGLSCLGHDDCQGGWCVEGPDDRVCTANCVDCCPAGWSCALVSVGGGGDQQSVCVPKEAKVCESCEARVDCGGIPECAAPAEASRGEEGGMCLLACDGVDAACPGGFECVSRPLLPDLEPGWLCAPEAGASCCAKANEGMEEECTRANEHGTCRGLRTCRGPDGWSPCTAKVPAAEECNLLDDDCNGETDEDLGVLCACGDGVCAAEGGEDARICPPDCGTCGDGLCSPGENPDGCPNDCCGGGCGDGLCMGYACLEDKPGSAYYCPADCVAVCGNGACEGGEGRLLCPDDCTVDVCGDGTCAGAEEDWQRCPIDCGPTCGNCVCEGTEGHLRCPVDCGFCGDGVCSPCGHLGEVKTCPPDCPSAAETCNGIDDDGDGETDEGACDDGNECTEDLCEPGTGVCTHPAAADGTECSDREFCTYGDICVGGTCAGTVVEGCCGSNADCPDDDDVCNGALRCDTSNMSPALWRCIVDPATVVICDAPGDTECEKNTCEPATGKCAMQTLPDGESCDDGNACTTADQCGEGKCEGGPAPDCDDGEVCTADACDPDLGCANEPREAHCYDGDPCTVDDRCEGGSCSGEPRICDDGEPCTDDACDAQLGCVHAKNEGPCDDGLDCTVGDLCREGRCTPGAPSTAPECRCERTADCPDSADMCPPTYACMDGWCTPIAGTQVVCDAGADTACLRNTCNMGTGFCEPRALGTEVTCDDKDPCTEDDRCDGEGACAGVPVECDDGVFCNGAERCDAATGRCVSGPPPAAASPVASCAAERCDEEAGAVSLVPDHTACDDQDPCTDDGCNPELGCTHTPSSELCDDGDPCTAGDTCSNGACSGVPGPCACQTVADCEDDGAACNGEPECHDGSCRVRPGSVVPCPEPGQCERVSCVPTTGGCAWEPKDRDTPCDDGDPCTAEDACDGVGRCRGTAVDCDDGLFCNGLETCTAGVGCESGPAPSLDDGVECTIDRCDEVEDAVVHVPDAVSCNDGDACTDDSCDDESGCVHEDNTAPCSDGVRCTYPDACADGICVPGPAVDCDDVNACTSDRCDPALGCVYEVLGDGTACDAGGGHGTGRCVSAACESDEEGPAPPVVSETEPPLRSNSVDHPTVKGGAEAYSTVRVYTTADCTGDPVAETQADASGHFSVEAEAERNAETTFRATATDAAGNTSSCSPAGVTYEHDDLAPPAPMLSGTVPASPGSNASPELEGTAEAGATVMIYLTSDCTGAVHAATTATGGSFSVGVTAAGNDTRTYYATATDAAGNTSQCSAGLSYTHDSTAPGKPVITGTTPSPPSQSLSPFVNVHTEPYAALGVYTSCGGSPIGSGAADASGDASVSVTVAADTTTTLYAKAADAAENVSACSDGFAYTNDRTAPSVSFTGTSPASPGTSLTPAVEGTTESNATVSLYTTVGCTGTVAASGPADGAGGFSLVVAVSEGSTTRYHGKAVDAAGNAGACSESFVEYQHEAASGCGNGTCDEGETALSCEDDCLVGGYAYVHAGEFLMGSPGDEPGRDSDEGPQRTVRITGGFWLKATEVTQAEWRQVMSTDPSYFSSCGDGCPVERVSWWDVVKYCNELSEDEGLEKCYVLEGCSGTVGSGCSAGSTGCAGDYSCSTVTFAGLGCEGYRLPTEAEWEYAARAGSTTAFYNGAITDTGRSPLDENLDAIGWYGGNSTATYAGAYSCSGWFDGADKCGPQPVGGKDANAWGLRDMSGNVYEWAWDWYKDDYYGTRADPDTDPLGHSSGSSRVGRGGSWYGGARNCRSASRAWSGPGGRNLYLGLRPARSAIP